ncbi:MAG: hypothetical protein O7A07_01220, partial [Acidobacteria bacterium]|nr:hypothetical protein [Acidobacteriota bacterium]
MTRQATQGTRIVCLDNPGVGPEGRDQPATSGSQGPAYFLAGETVGHHQKGRPAVPESPAEACAKAAWERTAQIDHP